MSERLTDEQLYAMTVNLTPFKGHASMTERLTDEQLREMARAREWPIEAATELLALRARVAELEAAHIEAMAELIYLRQHGKDGAVWWANESKDVWREKARDALKDAPK